MVHHVLHPFNQNTSQQVFFSEWTTTEHQKPKTLSPPPKHNSRASISAKSSSLFGFGMRRSRTHPFLHIARCLKLWNVFTYLRVQQVSLFSLPLFMKCSELAILLYKEFGKCSEPPIHLYKEFGAYWAYFNSLDRSVEALLWAFYFL